MSDATVTRDKFIEMYGDVRVRFSSYYKYTFTFVGEAEDGTVVSVGYGGDSGEIYRYSVGPTTEEAVRDIYPYTGEAHKDGKLVASFSNY